MTKDFLSDLADQATKMDIPYWLAPDHENSSGIYYRFLYLLAKAVKPIGSIVELGTWRGVSAMCLAEGAPQVPVFTMDISPQVLEWTKRPNIIYVSADSLGRIENAAPVEILFIDTEHEGPRARAEFEAWLPILSKRAIVLFDDVSLNDSMRDFWTSFNPDGFQKMDLAVHGAPGFGVVFRSTDDDGDKK